MKATRFGYRLLIMFTVLLVLPGAVWAQGGDPEQCPALVETALLMLEDTCGALPRESACYGHTHVEAVFREADAALRFTAPADTVPLLSVRALHTAPVNPETEEWGLAVINLRVNLPDLLPGQAVTFLLMGDARLEDITPPDHVESSAPMQAVYFTTGLGEPACAAAPDALLVQNSTGVEVALSVNGLEMSVASSALLMLAPDEERPGRALLVVTLLEGAITLRHPGFAAELLTPGDAVALPLDEGGLVQPTLPPVEIPPTAPVIARLQASCDALAAHGAAHNINREICAQPLRFTVPPFEYYEIGGFCSRRVGMNTTVPGQLLGFQKGIGRWPTVAEMQAGLAGSSAWFSIDGTPLPVYYEGPTWHTGGDTPDGYGDRARANWRATPGEHMVSGAWTGDDTYSCSFTVAE